MNQKRILVGIPCLNERATIAQVVKDFSEVLPDARIIVLDNGSTDDSASLARVAGAEVIAVERPGKGQVIRRLFADMDADCWLMVDGDGTYDPGSSEKLVGAVLEGGVDMAVGRREAISDASYRPGHALGNRLFTVSGQTRPLLTDVIDI